MAYEGDNGYAAMVAEVEVEEEMLLELTDLAEEVVVVGLYLGNYLRGQH